MACDGCLAQHDHYRRELDAFWYLYPNFTNEIMELQTSDESFKKLLRHPIANDLLHFRNLKYSLNTYSFAECFFKFVDETYENVDWNLAIKL